MIGASLQVQPKMLFKDKKQALDHLKSNGKYNKDGELVLPEGIHTMNYKLLRADDVPARTSTVTKTYNQN